MGHYIDKTAGFNVYDAPKSGGTTMRSWLKYKKHGELRLKEQKDGYSFVSEVSYDWECLYFKPYEGESICVKRDPVKRFVSCYKDKILRENRFKKPSIDEFLRNYKKYIKMDQQVLRSNLTKTPVKYLEYHFTPQYRQFGKDKTFYTHVFDISEMNTTIKEYFEDHWKISLMT